ncbi:hypothetical protein [Oceaniglobus roseus]|uniref:hypothetical protein n=1 Tax=Oceaniglobus roseus TaxID=1737570 RepID=UPI000C7E8DF4|nr:hypothetical protein [Kandeliimicrobium roseum]
MQKRYKLDQDVICHVWKSGTRTNGTKEPNDGAGGHATQDITPTDYQIVGIPPSRKGEADKWFKATLSEALKCPFAHIASFKIGTTKYLNKSMFPCTEKKDDLIKTIERALSSCTPGHTYDGQAKINASSGKPIVTAKDYVRPLSDMTVENGAYVVGRANGLRIKGQCKGAGAGGLTSVFPDTRGFLPTTEKPRMT